MNDISSFNMTQIIVLIISMLFIFSISYSKLSFIFRLVFVVLIVVAVRGFVLN